VPVKDRRRHYPSDLTDAQWELIKHLLPRARCGGRPRSTDIRQVVCGILYLVSTGGAWRYLPNDFPPWKTVYHYYRTWSFAGVWRLIHEELKRMSREAAGKRADPTYLIIDSQSVRAQSGEKLGYDGFKRVRGRKRQIVVDTLGFVHGVHIHRANLSDNKEAELLLEKLPQKLVGKIQVLSADLGYRGAFEEKCKIKFGFYPLIGRRENTGQGRRKTTQEKKEWARSRPLIEQPKRWIVERTFAWFNGYRRLNRDYEKSVLSSETMIYLGMTQLMMRRQQRKSL